MPPAFPRSPAPTRPRRCSPCWPMWPAPGIRGRGTGPRAPGSARWPARFPAPAQLPSGGYAMTRRLFGDGAYGKTPSPTSIGALTRDDAAALSRQLVAPRQRDPGHDRRHHARRPASALAEEMLGAWAKPAAALPAAAAAAAPAPREATAAHRHAEDRPGRGADGPRGPEPHRAGLLRRRWWPTMCSAVATPRASTPEIRIKRGLSYGAGSGLASRTARCAHHRLPRRRATMPCRRWWS